MEIPQMITELKTDVLGKLGKFTGDLDGVNQKFDGLQKELASLVCKMDKPGGWTMPVDPIKKAFEESDDWQRFKGRGFKGSAVINLDLSQVLNTKTAITEIAAGSGSAGVLMPQQLNGIVPLAQRRLYMRDLLARGGRTTQNAVYFVRENAWTSAASPQVEAVAKGESADTYTTTTASVRTLAHWIPASRQILDDFQGLLNFISGKLLYGLRYLEETEILFGSNVGQHLNGLVTQATAFNAALLVPASSGWNKADILRRAAQQVQSADESATNFYVVNPVDFGDIETYKDTTRNYVIGSPRGILPPTLWGAPVIVSTAMTSGTFLAGSSSAAELIDRTDAAVEISTEHSTYFTENMVAIRCEERVAMPVYRPASFITGSFTTSPA